MANAKEPTPPWWLLITPSLLALLTFGIWFILRSGPHYLQGEIVASQESMVAPINREMSLQVVKRGEQVTAGLTNVMNAYPDNTWVTFNIRENELPDYHLGDRISGRLSALGNHEIEFKVIFISSPGDSATLQATNKSSGNDLRILEVRACPLEPVQGLKPGMSVVVSRKKIG
jgi:HlyD family secretion protein